MKSMTTAVGEQAKEYVDKGVNAINTTAEKACQISESTDRYVHKNPWLVIGATAGVAASLGLVAGFLLRGRPSA